MAADVLLGSAAAAAWPLVAISAASRADVAPMRCLLVWINATLAHLAASAQNRPGKNPRGTNLFGGGALGITQLRTKTLDTNALGTNVPHCWRPCSAWGMFFKFQLRALVNFRGGAGAVWV